MAISDTTITVYADDASTTEYLLKELLEQHAARRTCKAPNCFSGEAIAYVEGGDGEDIPLCDDCRDIYGVRL